MKETNMLDAMEFIKKNPFPKNGLELTSKLVIELQVLKDGPQYMERKMELFKLNSRCIFLVFKQFNYNQTLDSIMSFMWENLDYCVKNYDINSKKPFYSYWMGYVRGVLQKTYNYTNNLVHVPVMKKKDTELCFTDINKNIGGSAAGKDSSSMTLAEVLVIDDDPDDIEYRELWEVIERFMTESYMSQEQRDKFNIVIKSLRYESIQDAAKDMKVNIGSLRISTKEFYAALSKFRERRLGIIKRD